jgi:hypothetical protein
MSPIIKAEKIRTTNKGYNMHYRQGSLYRRYVSDIDGLLKTLHAEVCQVDSFDAATKEAERKKYEEGIFPMRDSASAPRARMKRWQDEKDSPKPSAW